jgi:uncharacterized protein YbbC (DUF1343 family)
MNIFSFFYYKIFLMKHMNNILLKVFSITLIAVMWQGVLTGQVITGAARTGEYLPLLYGKKVAVVANQTSMIGETHLVDSLLSLGINIKKIFSPEHGFRGTADAGEHLVNYYDEKTGLPVISLYGKHRKPANEDMEGLDIVLFDIQDVGVRFYTYISTMHYLMEACAENNVVFLVLDRPNPNGFYVDGPVLDTVFRSFVGMHPVPVVHGMTVAEYAHMINGEGWLKDSLICNLKQVKCENYTHKTYYDLPVKSSPNLPNLRSVYLYPSLCFFEGTCISVGRGTDFPFQVFGHPDYPDMGFSFTPRSIEGAATNPKFEGEVCYGVDLSHIPFNFVHNNRRLVLDWLIDAYSNMDNKDNFFNNYFDKLAGNSTLRKQIIAGKSKWIIYASWKSDIKDFKIIRKKHLLYKDFE